MLLDFITGNRDEIIKRAQQRMRERTTPNSKESELEHGIPLLLSQLAAALRVSREEPEQLQSAGALAQKISDSADENGQQLLTQGFSVAQMVHEYGDLCQIVTALATEMSSPLSARDFHIFNRCLDEAVVGALKAHAAQREAELAAQQTARVEAVTRLAHERKMESLGRLAGGISHDFNNLLTAILGNLELASLDLPLHSAVQVNLSDARRAGESAKSLVRQLLLFGRKQRLEVMVLDLGVALQDTVRLLARLMDDNIALVLTVPPTPVYARLDPMHVEQLVINLALNARDAMPQGGTLRIDVGSFVQENQRMLRLTVSDTGEGMSQEVCDRAFEPFFTTKQPGSGTGLGLALVFAAVEQNNGKLSVESHLGTGTTFVIEFAEAEAEDSEPLIPIAPVLAMTGGKETIFLVEDQRELSRFAQRSLRRLGYTVTAFASAEALLDAGDQIGQADLLLSDVMLPGLSGPALAERLVASHPGLRVLFASGYHADSLRGLAGAMSSRNVLPKPFSVEELATAIRDVLDSPCPAS